MYRWLDGLTMMTDIPPANLLVWGGSPQLYYIAFFLRIIFCSDQFILPAVNQDAYMCGYFKMFGRIVVHSISLFSSSHLSWKKNIDAAIEYLTITSLPLDVKSLISEVQSRQVNLYTNSANWCHWHNLPLVSVAAAHAQG